MNVFVLNTLSDKGGNKHKLMMLMIISCNSLSQKTSI